MKFVWICSIVLVVFLGYVDADTKLTSVERNIDLTTNVARQDITIEATNEGSSVSSLDFTLENAYADKLAFFTASQGEAKLQVTQQRGESDSTYTMQMNEAAESVTVNVELAFTETMTPFPTEIEQEESQRVVYNDNVFFYSPYSVDTQTTTVTLASDSIEDQTEQTPFQVNGKTITYGPYENVEAKSSSPLRIHFENNSPFLTAVSFIKEVEVSHWGNVAVEESYVIVHTGAKLEGSFNRLDFQRNKDAAVSAVTQFDHYLPLDATDVYYRDAIGNVSTSHVRQENDRVVMEMIPRFPLFGGWTTKFYMGYNLPLWNYVFQDTKSSTLVLKIDFAKSFNIEIPITSATFRVILPEGSTNVQLHTPFDVAGKNEYLHYTYLDTSGRPVIEVTKNNLVADHNQQVQITYEFSTISLLKEPFLLVATFFSIFLAGMFFVRFRLSISPDNSAEDKKDKAVKEYLVKLKKVTSDFASLCRRLKAVRGSSKEKDSINAELSQAFASLQSIRSGLEELDEDLGAQVEQIIRKSKETQGYLIQIVDLEIQKKQSKVPVDVYQKSRRQYQANFETSRAELYALVGELTEEI